MIEEWKPFFNGLYEVSNLGNTRRAVDGINTKAGRLKKPSINTYGYLMIGAFDNGKRTNVFVHRAVMEAFVGPCPEGMAVNHKDGNKLNNRVDNLEYVTPKENMIHAAKHGLTAKGEKHGTKTKPESILRGEDHWTRHHPEKVARGDKNGARKYPERLQRGEDRPASKLTEDDVREIRKLYELGNTQKELAKQFKVSTKNIYLIINRRAWCHVK